MIDLDVIMPRKPTLWFEGEPELMASVGKLSVSLMKARIEGPNVDADGKPLPRLSRRVGWFTSADDLRVKGVDGVKYYRTRDGRELEQTELATERSVAVAVERQGSTYRYERRDTGKGVAMFWAGYEGLKKRKTGSAKRGASFTGEMWRSLQLKVGKKKVGKVREPTVRFVFSASEVQGTIDGENYKSGKPKKNRVQNRTKARMLQYSKRNRDGTPKGQPDFLLVRLSEEEVGKVVDLIKSHLRLTRPA